MSDRNWFQRNLLDPVWNGAGKAYNKVEWEIAKGVHGLAGDTFEQREAFFKAGEEMVDSIKDGRPIDAAWNGGKALLVRPRDWAIGKAHEALDNADPKREKFGVNELRSYLDEWDTDKESRQHGGKEGRNDFDRMRDIIKGMDIPLISNFLISCVDFLEEGKKNGFMNAIINKVQSFFGGEKDTNATAAADTQTSTAYHYEPAQKNSSDMTSNLSSPALTARADFNNSANGKTISASLSAPAITTDNSLCAQFDAAATGTQLRVLPDPEPTITGPSVREKAPGLGMAA